MSHKLKRLNELIKEVLGEIILKEEEFGLGVLVTIMGVKTSDDILHSNVFISVFPTEKREVCFRKADSTHIRPPTTAQQKITDAAGAKNQIRFGHNRSKSAGAG